MPVALAGLALVAVTAVACGNDDGSDTVADDPTSSSSTSDQPSASASSSASPSESSSSGQATPEPDPVPSPLINKAVRAAVKDDFPALVPAGVPAGWTVVSAAYAPGGGGTWTISLTDAGGAPVTLLQTTGASADLAARLVPDAQASGNVRISGTGKWTVYEGTAGAALAKDLSGTGVAVAGPDVESVTTLVQQLLTAEDGGHTDGG